MACWYASAQMLIRWRRNRTQSTEMAFSDPSEYLEAIKLYMANNDLQWNCGRIRCFACLFLLVTRQALRSVTMG